MLPSPVSCNPPPYLAHLHPPLGVCLANSCYSPHALYDIVPQVGASLVCGCHSACIRAFTCYTHPLSLCVYVHVFGVYKKCCQQGTCLVPQMAKYTLSPLVAQACILSSLSHVPLAQTPVLMAPSPLPVPCCP